MAQIIKMSRHGGGNKARSTSVQKTIVFIFIVTYCLTFISLATASRAQSVIVKDYSRYIMINESISDLSLKFPETHNYFKQYIRNREAQSLEDYARSIIELKKGLEALEGMIKFDPNTKVFFRNTLNMFDRYLRQTSTAMNNIQAEGPDSYALYSDIERQMDYIIGHMQFLTKSYLENHNESYQESISNYNQQMNRSYLFITVTLSIAALFTFYAISKILKSIHLLCAQASMLSTKQWDVEDVEENRYEELNTLGDAFNNMKHEIKAYLEEEILKAELTIQLKEEQLKTTEKDRLLKETQLEALQMQMNPHFLFNTLNIISRLALFEDVPDITKVTEELSEILRYNLYYKDELVSLTKELEVLEAYVNIQSRRFEDNIVFEFDICDETDGILIPPMILQPLVENAIIHGCKDKKTDGKVVVLVYRSEGYMNVLIIDNGDGINNNEDPSRVKIKSGGRIGLANVRKRLSIVFGRDDLISIHSEANKGFTVMVQIPLGVEDV